RRGTIATGRHVVAQRRVRPLVVVFEAEAPEAALLRRRVARRGARRFRLEHGMKLFVRSILVRASEGDPLGDDAEADPPDRQPREAAEAGAGKRAAVVAPNALWQTVLSERAFKPPTRRRVGRPAQRVTAQHESAEPIPQR